MGFLAILAGVLAYAAVGVLFAAATFLEGRAKGLRAVRHVPFCLALVAVWPIVLLVVMAAALWSRAEPSDQPAGEKAAPARARPARSFGRRLQVPG